MPDDTSICSATNETPSFIWIEFLDPKDGIGFCSAAKSGGKKTPQWINLLEYSKGEKSNKKNLPVPGRGGSLEITSTKGTADLFIFDLRYGGLKGTVAYPNAPVVYTGDKYSEPNDEWYNAPFVETSCGVLRPSIYIVSGHGSQGQVFGEGDNVGAAYIHNLKTGPETRVLIIPSCSNINYTRGYRLKELIRQSEGLIAILGYEHTYHGGPEALNVMSEFVGMVRNGTAILESWRKANESQGVSRYPWSAIFAKAPENAHLKFDVANLISPPMVYRESNPIFYSCTSPSEGREIKLPDVVAYFLKKSSPTENGLRELYTKEDDAEKFARFEFSKIPSGSTQQAFVVGDTTGKGFKVGEVVALFFYVVRPDWAQPVNLDKVLKFDETSPFAHSKISCISSGSGKNLVLFEITSDCENIFALADIHTGAAEHLKTQAFHNGQNPSFLLCSCLRGKIDSQGTISCEATDRKNPNATNNYKFAKSEYGKIQWDRSPYVIDLRIFPTKFDYPATKSQSGYNQV